MEKKIAVASDDGLHITGHVGRCEMFIIFNIENNNILNIEKRINTFTRHRSEHQHTHEHKEYHSGRHYGIIEGLRDCNYLICSAAGPSLIEDLEKSGINVILTEEIEAKKAVELFLNGNLPNNPNRSCQGHNH